MIHACKHGINMVMHGIACDVNSGEHMIKFWHHNESAWKDPVQGNQSCEFVWHSLCTVTKIQFSVKCCNFLKDDSPGNPGLEACKPEIKYRIFSL